MRIGFTCSSFDLLHAGHTLMLEEARSQCDYLIVGMQLDPTVDRPNKNKPIQTVVERYLQLRGSKYVDEIIPYSTEQDLEDILSSMHIDVRIVGIEYMGREFTGKDICNQRNIEIYYNERVHRFSSSDSVKRILDNE
tara:strand:- start:3700 stop:4110 length:411 start_codon:yes stop_codon:yes gene_type:complete